MPVQGQRHSCAWLCLAESGETLFRVEEPEPRYHFSGSSKGYQSPPGKAGKPECAISNVKVQQEETAACRNSLCKVISERGQAAAEGSSTLLQFSSKRLDLALPLWEGRHVMASL